MTRLHIQSDDSHDGEILIQTIRDSRSKGEIVAEVETEIANGAAGHEYLKITVRRHDEARVGPVVVELV